MATQELRKRANWQTISGAKALGVEKLFQKSLQAALDAVYPGQFRIERHPKEFGDIYSTYPLPPEVLDKIYNVDVTAKKANGKPKYEWGISMDFAIRNIKNGKFFLAKLRGRMAGLRQPICKQAEEMPMNGAANTLHQD